MNIRNIIILNKERTLASCDIDCPDHGWRNIQVSLLRGQEELANKIEESGVTYITPPPLLPVDYVGAVISNYLLMVERISESYETLEVATWRYKSEYSTAILKGTATPAQIYVIGILAGIFTLQIPLKDVTESSVVLTDSQDSELRYYCNKITNNSDTMMLAMSYLEGRRDTATKSMLVTNTPEDNQVNYEKFLSDCYGAIKVYTT